VKDVFVLGVCALLWACSSSNSTKNPGDGSPGGDGPAGGNGPTAHALFVATGCKVEVIDLASNAVVFEVDLCSTTGGSGLTGMAANGTARRGYASVTGGPVVAFDMASGAVVGSAQGDAAGAFERLEINADGTTGYVVDATGPINVLSFTSSAVSLGGTLSNGYQVTGSTSTTVVPTVIALDTMRDQLAALVSANGYHVDLWDTAGRSVAKSIPFPTGGGNNAGLPFDAALDPTTDLLWVHVGDLGASFHQGVSVVDLAAGAVTHTIDFGFNDGITSEGTLAVNSSTHMVYALDQNPAAITIVDGTSFAKTGSIPLGVAQATTIVVNPGTNTAYVTAGQSVLVVDLASKAVTTTIPLPDSAVQRLGMALVP
jgi:hypothetical protein